MAEVKAWTYTTPGYPNCLTQQKIKTPSSLPTPTSVQIKVHSAALNPVDIQLMNIPFWSIPYLNHPKGVGCDFSGTILRAGSDSGYAEGDEVFGLQMAPGGAAGVSGTCAEVVTFDVAKGTTMMRKPREWSWNQAAALPLVWLTARTCIERVNDYVKEGGTVAVLGGSSATGMYTVHLAKERGWKVVATCSDRNEEFVRSWGAERVVDYTKESVPEKVREARPDAIIDCVGGTECIGIAKRYVTIVGDKTSRSVMGGPASYFFTPRMVVRWFWGYMGLGEKYDCVILEGKNEYLEEATRLPQDKIQIDSTYEFDDLKKALERLNTSRARGKVVVEVTK